VGSKVIFGWIGETRIQTTTGMQDEIIESNSD